jgi:hypothetical protein
MCFHVTGTGKGQAQNLLLLRADGQLFELVNRRP